MTLRKLPEINAARLPDVCSFLPDEQAFDDWNAGVMAQQTPENTISILDMIGEDWLTGGGVTSRRISAALRSIGDQEIYVDINSPGGDFFEGVAIYNALRAHPQKVTVRILGLAASAASLIAMAGDEIQIGKAGFAMVHDAWVIALGNRHDMTEAANVLETFDDAMATVYAERAGVEKSTAAEWMDNETWFNGERAVAEGLADSYLPADQVTEDPARAQAATGTKPVQKLEFGLARAGMSRDKRRSLIGEATGHSAVANAERPAVADDDEETTAALQRLIETISS